MNKGKGREEIYAKSYYVKDALAITALVKIKSLLIQVYHDLFTPQDLAIAAIVWNLQSSKQ